MEARIVVRDQAELIHVVLVTSKRLKFLVMRAMLPASYPIQLNNQKKRIRHVKMEFLQREIIQLAFAALKVVARVVAPTVHNDLVEQMHVVLEKSFNLEFFVKIVQLHVL